MVVNGEHERIEEGAASECYEYKVFVKLFFLINAATDHEGATKKGRSVVFDIKSSSCPQPLTTL